MPLFKSCRCISGCVSVASQTLAGQAGRIQMAASGRTACGVPGCGPLTAAAPARGPVRVGASDAAAARAAATACSSCCWCVRRISLILAMKLSWWGRRRGTSKKTNRVGWQVHHRRLHLTLCKCWPTQLDPLPP